MIKKIHKTSGLSILEALVSTAIVGIGFIAILQMTNFSVQSIDNSGERTKANFLTEMIAEDVIGSKDSFYKLDLNDPDIKFNNSTGEYEKDDTPLDNFSRYGLPPTKISLSGIPSLIASFFANSSFTTIWLGNNKFPFNSNLFLYQLQCSIIEIQVLLFCLAFIIIFLSTEYPSAAPVINN